MQLSVIIVNYKVPKHLTLCLQSIQDAILGIDAEIIVIDNNSEDDSEKWITSRFPEVNWIQSKKNLGFGNANNLAVSQAKGKYIALVNPDTFLPETIFYKLIPYAENIDKLGIIGVKMIDGFGNFHPESKRSKPNPSNTFNKLFYLNSKIKPKEYYANEIPENGISEIEVLSGAFFFLKKSVFQELEGFDPKYFMYGEDIDLCVSAMQKGYKNYYFGECTLLHYKGESTIKGKIYFKRFFGAMKIYTKKYHSKNPILYLFILAGIQLKYYWNLLESFSKKTTPTPLKTTTIKEIEVNKNAVDIISKIAQQNQQIALRPIWENYHILPDGTIQSI